MECMACAGAGVYGVFRGWKRGIEIGIPDGVRLENRLFHTLIEISETIEARENVTGVVVSVAQDIFALYVVGFTCIPGFLGSDKDVFCGMIVCYELTALLAKKFAIVNRYFTTT